MLSRQNGVKIGYSLFIICEKRTNIQVRTAVATNKPDLANKIQQNLGVVADSRLKLVRCVAQI